MRDCYPAHALLLLLAAREYQCRKTENAVGTGALELGRLHCLPARTKTTIQPVRHHFIIPPCPHMGPGARFLSRPVRSPAC